MASRAQSKHRLPWENMRRLVSKRSCMLFFLWLCCCGGMSCVVGVWGIALCLFVPETDRPLFLCSLLAARQRGWVQAIPNLTQSGQVLVLFYLPFSQAPLLSFLIH